MRNIPENIAYYLNNGERFVYCFKIAHRDKTLYLTSNDEPINLEDGTYLPNSGLEIKKMIFNDSAYDLIEVGGIFEEGGIEKIDDLSGYSAEVMLYFPAVKTSYFLLEYCVSRIARDDLKFTLYLAPISAKLNQSLLSYFGAKCRAKFGDCRCGIDLAVYPAGTYCDKNFRTCCNKFNNAVNFRGEPFIPCAP